MLQLSLFLERKQYHGGTNFGRTTGGPFISTSYDYDAPIDEYGMEFFNLCISLIVDSVELYKLIKFDSI